MDRGTARWLSPDTPSSTPTGRRRPVLITTALAAVMTLLAALVVTQPAFAAGLDRRHLHLRRRLGHRSPGQRQGDQLRVRPGERPGPSSSTSPPGTPSAARGTPTSPGPGTTTRRRTRAGPARSRPGPRSRGATSRRVPSRPRPPAASTAWPVPVGPPPARRRRRRRPRRHRRPPRRPPRRRPPTPPPPGGKKLVGYFAEWGVYGRNYHVKNIDTSGSASKLTHILYAFGNITGGRCVDR